MRRLTTRIATSIFSLVILCLSFQVSAQDGAPTETVQTTVNAILEILRDDALDQETKRDQMRDKISAAFDARAMSQSVLSTNWRQASKPQQEEFQSLFMQTLEDTYMGRLEAYTNETVEYLDQRMRSKKLATVSTLIKTDTVDIPVDYKLYLTEAGTWRAYDVVIEQVSLVRNYRGSFQTIVHQDGIEGLLTKLETKVAQSSADES